MRLETAESNLDSTLASLSISVIRPPAYSEDAYQFQIGEQELRDEIENEIEHISEHAIEHDIRAVRHIYALREGRHVSTIEDSRYVFLTTNAALSRAAFSYERKQTHEWIFSGVVTDFHLSHLVWLKSPMTAADLPRAEILANCYATMKPSALVWNRFLAETERLRAENKVSERDHEVLRYSLNSPDELMDVTRGDVEGINASNIHNILERLEKTYAADKEKELQRARQEHDETKRALAEVKSAADERLAELADAAAREDALRQEHAAQNEQLRNLRKNEGDALERESRRKEKLERIAGRTATGAFLVIGVLTAGFGLLSLFSNWSLWLSVPFVVFGVLNFITGFSGPSVKRYVRDWVARWISKFTE